MVDDNDKFHILLLASLAYSMLARQVRFSVSSPNALVKKATTRLTYIAPMTWKDWIWSALFTVQDGTWVGIVRTWERQTVQKPIVTLP
jgi:hypothetical protein